MRDFLATCYLFSPLFVGLIVHGLCIKYGALRSLERPIDGGASLRGRRLFGANKTWRGIVAVALGTAFGMAIESLASRAGIGRDIALIDYANPAVVGLGLAMGAAAMFAELPNSLLKRQLGIAPGAAAPGAIAPIFYALDQIDLVAGAWAVLWVVVPITATRLLWSVVFVFVVHQVLTYVGYRLGMRTTAR